MSEFRIPMQLTYGRNTADGSGMQPASSQGVSFLTGALDDRHAPGFILAFGDMPRWAHIVACTIYVRGSDDRWLQSLHGRTDWITNSSMAPMTGFLANLITTFDDDTRNLVRVDDVAAATIGADGNTFQAWAEWKVGPAGGVGNLGLPDASGVTYPQWSSGLYSEYADNAQDDDPPIGDLRGLFSRQENLLAQRGGGSTTITLPSGEVQLGSCDQAFTDPFGKVFLRSSDIGVGPGQISDTVSNWLANQFRNHPSVFARLTDHVRGIATASNFGVADTQPLNSTPAVCRLYEVTRAPTHSSWLLMYDGLPQVVTFTHPTGSDLRRPSEIWNGVVFPAITSRSGIGTPGSPTDPVGTAGGITDAITSEASPASGVFILATPAFPNNVFRQRQALPRRMQHLEYARLLELWDAPSIYDDPPYVEVTLSP